MPDPLAVKGSGLQPVTDREEDIRRNLHQFTEPELGHIGWLLSELARLRTEAHQMQEIPFRERVAGSHGLKFPTEPPQLIRDLHLEDLWVAYRHGARDGRAAPSVTDEQIERACDAYVKLVIERQHHE